MISKFKRVFNDLAIKGLDEGLDDVDYVRGKMINTFILVYVLASIPFFVVRLVSGDYLSSFVNFIIISQLLVAYLISVKKDHQTGAVYFLFVLLFFQVMLLFSAFHVNVLFYLAALPVLFALLFNSTSKKNILFIITFCLILVYYFQHHSPFSLVVNYFNITGISYFIISKFVELTEKNQRALNVALEEKQLMIERLHKRNEELEQFNFITSHDLQEPLKTITTYSALLLDKKKDHLDEVSKDSLHFMNQAADRMTGLIHDIFNYSQINKMSLLGPVDIEKIIESVKKDFKKEIEEKKVAILYDKLPIIVGYEKELSLLFHSLISNAIKFSKKEEIPVIQIMATNKEKAWQFIIVDNGIGIEVSDYDKVFKMFHRLQSKASYRGNGAGLAYCHKIVELHEGEIWIDSEVGKGSSFYFTIKKNITDRVLLPPITTAVA